MQPPELEALLSMWHEMEKGNDSPKPDEAISQSSEPLTYSRFLEHLDKAKREFRRVDRVTVNRRTLVFLLDDMRATGMTTEGCWTIYGIPIEVDVRLPDNIIKFVCSGGGV